MTPDPDVMAALGALGDVEDSNLPLAETAVLLAAAIRPGIEPSAYHRHIRALATEVGAYAGQWAGEDLERRAESLVQVLARRYGYTVATEDASADVALTIDRRGGPAVALAILYIDAARAQGWTATAVNFPARTLVRLEAGAARLLLDPTTGKTVAAPALRELVRTTRGDDRALMLTDFATLSARDILMTLTRARQTELDESERAKLVLLESLTLIAPAVAQPWRECGLLALALGDLKTAVRALERWLGIDRDSPERPRTWVLVRELNERLA
ncbi:MAG: hypothetical protein EXQ90_00265 [Rhodospirillales bacterium]|nr:hypothetical protein [Rhodospirillales bacterium]